MSESVKGTAHIFGVGEEITNATVVSITTSEEFDLNEVTHDEDGVTIETRRDDRVKRATVVLRIRSQYSFPDIGSTLALTGLEDSNFNTTYEIVNKGQAYQSRFYIEQTLELVAHEGITYT